MSAGAWKASAKAWRDYAGELLERHADARAQSMARSEQRNRIVSALFAELRKRAGVPDSMAESLALARLVPELFKELGGSVELTESQTDDETETTGEPQAGPAGQLALL